MRSSTGQKRVGEIWCVVGKDRIVAFDSIVLAGGCFWCLEAVFRRFDGVVKADSGYAGGTVPHPTYEQVCTGGTGHAEVVKVEFDTDLVNLEELFDLFWRAHDPTTLNRQGADVGTQYRSAIFYRNEEQRATAEKSRTRAQAAFADPIVTEIARLETFFPAEEYHRDFYENNPRHGYCRMVIEPKLRKVGFNGVPRK